MQESIDATRTGHNRTGMQSSPRMSKEMNDTPLPVAIDAAGASPLIEVRLQCIQEADALGSVPPPTQVKGLLKTGAKMLKGDRPQAFIDKLAERLAYERGGTRLYDAVIAKVIAHQNELDDLALQSFLDIREEEASHAALLQACLEELGADPTAQTPSADLVGITTIGFLQAASDPRTTLAHTLQVALAAELVDGAGWEILIAMAENMDQEDMAERFRVALEHETEHLAIVRRWYEALTLETGELM